MANFIENIFKNKDEKNDINSVFKNKSSITADDAYRVSRYGEVKTDKQLLEEFFLNVRDLIRNKNSYGKYCGMVEVNNDIIQYIPQIKHRLMDELGFKVIILDDNSIISNTETNIKEYLTAGTTFILLIWTKDAIKDVERLDNSSDKTDLESAPDYSDKIDLEVPDYSDLKPLNS